MNALKKIVVSWAVGALAMVGLNAAVHADAITDSITSDFEVKFADFEFANPAEVGSLIAGIFSVSSINQDGTSNLFWASMLSDDTQLNGFFTNIVITGVSADLTTFRAEGGLFTVYNVDGAVYDPATLAAGIDPATQLCGGPCPDPWLTALFVPGIGFITGDLTSTVIGSIDTTNPISGDGAGFMSTADLSGLIYQDGAGGLIPLGAGFVGTENAFFDTDGFVGGTADLLFGSRFFQCGFPDSPSGCALVGNDPRLAISDDPVRGKIAQIPEPGTLALLGLSMAGFALARRRGKA